MNPQKLLLYRFLREFRLSRDMILKDMSNALGLGVAELSSIEHGKKPIPEGFVDKLRENYTTTLKEDVHLYLIEKFQQEGSL